MLRLVPLVLFVACGVIEGPGQMPPPPPADAVQGALETLDAMGNVKGWARQGTAVVDVAISIDGAAQVTTAAAGVRDDATIGNHGFAWHIPSSFFDGQPHSLSAKVGTTELTGSPKSFTLRAPASVIGFFDAIDGDGNALGWALDRSNGATQLTVTFWVDGPQGTGTMIGTATANLPRGDINTATGVSGDHGFSFALPASLRDGAMHALYAYAGPVLLQPSPRTFTLARPHVDPASFSIAQLRDLQGDLMIWVPALKPAYVNGVDPVTGMNEKADNGATPNGLANGWVWSLMIDRYPAAQRELIYQAVLAQGFTHFAVQVTGCRAGDTGYHGLFPTDAAFCANHDALLNTILQELWDHRIIPLCSGVSPTDPVAPGLDRSLCRLVMNDWDNSRQLDCRVDTLAQTFPNAQILLEIAGGSPGNDPAPQMDSCSPQPWPTDYGQWLGFAQARHPNLFAVAYEINEPDGISANTAYVNSAHALYQNIQEIRFETDTYWKFWDNLDVNAEKTYNDNLQAAVPYLSGFMSGGTTHAPPPLAPPPPLNILPSTPKDMIDLSQVTIVGGSPGDIASWPVTTAITSVDLEAAVGSIDFDKRTGPNAWPDTLIPGWNGGMLQYTIWLALKINGQWYASGFIQYWAGRPNTIDWSSGASGNWQFQKNWYYDGRWAPMQGHVIALGEPIGFFVTSGNERAGNDVTASVHERSNIVVVPFADGMGAHYTQ